MSVRFVLAVAGAALLGVFELATPAAAHVLVQPDPVSAYALTSGRLWSAVGALLGLVGVVIGGLALARSAGRIGNRHRRTRGRRGPGGGAGRRGHRRAGRGRRRRWSRHRLRNSRGLRGPGGGADRHGPRRAGSGPLPPHQLTIGGPEPRDSPGGASSVVAARIQETTAECCPCSLVTRICWDCAHGRPEVFTGSRNPHPLRLDD